MKITKSQLRQIIKEEIESLPIDNLIGGINGLVQGMDPELVGVVFTTVFRQLEGEESPVEQQPEEEEPQPKTPIGFDRKPESPSGQTPTRIGFEEQLRKMIKEEIEERLYQKGEQTPAKIIAADLRDSIGCYMRQLIDMGHDEDRVAHGMKKLIGDIRLSGYRDIECKTTPTLRKVAEDLEEILGAQRQQVAKNTPIVIGKAAPGYVWDKIVGGYVHQNYKGRRLSPAEEQKLDAAVKAYQASSLREEETHRCSIGTGEGRWDRSIKSAAECKAAGGKWVDLKKFLGKFGEAREET